MAKQASPLLPADLWADVLAVRARRPLVHSITNLVVMNFNANVLLAMGASPVMAHAHEEVADMAAIAQALVLNIGTLEPYWINSMCQALDVATARGIPTVLDPVGVGATCFRNESIRAILRQAMPSVIRGNASEIMSVAGTAAQTRGVDRRAAVADAVQAARDLADVARAAGQPVDYLGISPVYATPTKTDTAMPWGLAGLRQVRTLTGLPLVAIGGIHQGNAAEVLQAGADGLAVVSAICSAPDPGAAARSFQDILKAHSTP